MMTKQEITELINSSNVHQIRSGRTHRFIDITIVATEGRFFVRQYKFGKGSWYQAFKQNPEGEIKYGDTIIPIVGKVPDDLKEVNPKVNKAYKKKLGLIYPIMKLGFDTQQHEASTLELIPVL